MQGWRIRAAMALTAAVALLTLGCSDHASVTDSLDYAKGTPGPPDDKGGEEGASNNLSFPVIFSDGMASGDFVPMTTPWTFATVEWQDGDGLACTPYTTGCFPGTTETGAFQRCVNEFDITPGDPVPDEYLCYYGPKNLGLDEETGDWNLVYPAKVWWLQERTQNKWQVFNAVAGSEVDVTALDFGDLLESTTSLKQKQVRTEVALFLNAAGTEFDPYIASDFGGTCDLAANPAGCFATHNMSGAVPGTDQSINEVQGTDYPETFALLDPVLAKGYHATVYARCARLVIQRFTPGSILSWNSPDGHWDGAETPTKDLAAYENEYTAEINAGGSMIFGYNWNTKGVLAGNYRITFVIDGIDKCPVSNTVFGTTALINPGNVNPGNVVLQSELPPGSAEGGLAYVDIYVGK
ncbi:MAG: hypothetical protein IH616_09650 [Gemmatimonadales bacterium]|nr:hypothetical protein [Gemmatimonadales bacterium]